MARKVLGDIREYSRGIEVMGIWELQMKTGHEGDGTG